MSTIADDIEATLDTLGKLVRGETTVDELGEKIFGGKPANDDGKPPVITPAPASSPTTPPPASETALEQAKALATVTPIRR